MSAPTYSQWIALMIDDLNHDYDVVVCFDGDDLNRHGPVGLGKTALMITVAKSLNPDFEIKRDMVIRDDIINFKRQIQDRRPLKVVAIDEAEWFFNRQWWMKSQVKALTPEFGSNRKEGRIWLLALPKIWQLVKFMFESRIQWRCLIKSRGYASLYVRTANRFNNEAQDKWGWYCTSFKEIPMVPPFVWDEYQDLIDQHPVPCLKGRCVSASLH